VLSWGLVVKLNPCCDDFDDGQNFRKGLGGTVAMKPLANRVHLGGESLDNQLDNLMLLDQPPISLKAFKQPFSTKNP
jgi:hypothetical protein